jgi:DNA-binding transcriptional ArsR family regulator
MKIPYSTLKYHLNFLEKRELIDKKPGRKYNRYYVSYKIGREDKKILGVLQENTPRHIILFFLIGIATHQNEISKYLEKHPTTIEFHLKKLLELDIIEIVHPEEGVIHRDEIPSAIEYSLKSNEKYYALKDHWHIHDLFITYEGNLIDDVTSGFILEFISEMLSDGLPKNVDRTKDAIDKVLEVFLELFPLPYRV